MSGIAELLARVEAATGPDHQLDGDIAVALGLFTPDEFWRRGTGLYGDRWTMGAFVKYEAPHVTHSVDAAVALVEKVLPGWDHGYESGDMIAFGKVWQGGRHDDTVTRAEGYTPALAILTALLRALPSPVHPQGS